MRFVIFIAVLQLYDCKHHSKSKPRSISLALETVLDFGKNDNSADMEIIDNVQGFLSRVKQVLSKKRNNRRNYQGDGVTVQSFTEFIKNGIRILNSYNDEDLKDVVTVVEDEMRKYHYRGSQFYELIDNHDARRCMADTLEKFKDMPVNKVRDKMNRLLDKMQDDNIGLKYKILGKYIDSLYNAEDAVKLGRVLDNLSVYKRNTKRSNLDLVNIVKNGLRSVIFDHYSKLDEDTRTDLKSKLQMLWQDYIAADNNQQRNTFTRISPLDVNKVDGLEKKEKKHPVRVIKQNVKSVVNDKDSIERDLRLMKRSTNKPKLTFITLYPEEITLKKITRRTRHKKKYTKKDYDHLVRYTGPSSNKYGVKPDKVVISENRESGQVERPRHTDTIVDSELNKPLTRPRKIRYNIVRRNPELQSTLKNKKKRKITSENRIKYNSSPPSDSLEGISIEIRDKKSLRKNNDNDTVIFTTVIPSASNVTTSESEQNFRERIVQLEKEMKDVKAKITIENKMQSSETKQYEELDFWKGTTKPDSLVTISGSFTTKVPKRTTERDTTIVTSPSTTESTSVTMSPVNMSKISFRSNDNITDAITKEISREKSEHVNKTRAAAAAKTTPKKYINKKASNVKNKKKVDKKSHNVTSVALAKSTPLFSNQNNPENDTASRKNIIENEISLDDNKQFDNDFDLHTYLNETAPASVDDKSELVRKKIIEDS